MTALVDLHSHVLFGLDDGAPTLQDSVEIARASAAGGVAVLAATPHVRSDYPTRPAEMRRRLQAVRDEVDRAGVPLRIVPGGEVSFEMLDRVGSTGLAAFALAGSRYLLVEPPYSGLTLNTGVLLLRLRAAGFVPVIAHPERNPDVQAEPERLRPLVEAGALVQLTASSLTRRRGSATCATASALLRARLAHLVASDAHAPSGAQLAAGLRRLGDERLALWLGRDVPRAIVDDAEIPTRPEPRPRRRAFGRARAGSSPAR